MKRWTFISGLTVILLLLLVLSGFCIWTARTLSDDIDRLITNNFETLRTLRGLRASVARIDAQYRVSTSVGDISPSRSLFDLEKAEMGKSVAKVRRTFAESGELARVERLEALVKDYFAYYEEYFSLGRTESDKFKAITRSLAQSSADITDVAGTIADFTEDTVLRRRAVAVVKGQRVVGISLGIALFSLGIYIWTSVRLTQAVFDPLRELRDSIVKVGKRQFDVVLPLKGSDELAQIATTFNQMAAELRAYVEESDHRVVEANRVSRAILEALPYPIYIVDEEFNVKLKNPRAAQINAALKITGQLPGVVRKCIDDAAALGCELVGDDLRRAVEISLPDTPPGQSPSFLPQVFRMAAAPGMPSGWAVLLMDVTKLRQFDQAKTKAIAMLGHEVKTPVTSIRLVLHLLLEEKIGPLSSDQRELITAGRDDCERLLIVLQALLELARFESGRVEIKLSPVAPAGLLAQAEAMHGGYFRGSSAPIVVEPVPNNVALVQADEMHAVRILGNFLSNAAKYRLPETPVTLCAEERADGFVRLSVRNQTDRPLSEVEQAHVFEPFYRRAGEAAEGTGLGLSICREIASAHGGRVGVWSEHDHVEFYLDLRKVA